MDGGLKDVRGVVELSVAVESAAMRSWWRHIPGRKLPGRA